MLGYCSFRRYPQLVYCYLFALKIARSSNFVARKNTTIAKVEKFEKNEKIENESEKEKNWSGITKRK